MIFHSTCSNFYSRSHHRVTETRSSHKETDQRFTVQGLFRHMSQVYYCTVHKVRWVSCGDLESKDQRLKIIVFVAEKITVLYCSITVCNLPFCTLGWLLSTCTQALTLFQSRIWSACIYWKHQNKYSKPYWNPVFF